MKQLTILVGKSGAGKTTVAKLLNEIEGFDRIITYTTRPKREGERNGYDYNFISVQKFKSLEAEGFFAETASYHTKEGEWFYGTAKKDLDNPNGLIVLTPSGAKAVRTLGVPCKIFYLSIPYAHAKCRLGVRGDNTEEIERRLLADEKDFADIYEIVDYVIAVNGYPPESVAFEIIAEILRK